MNLTEEDLKQIAKVVRYMAESGRGTDYCLEEGCLPLMTHFYTPIPDIKELEKRKVWDRISSLSGLNMNGPGQVSLLTEMATKFSKECNWPKDATDDLHQFHWLNHSFSFECASLLHYMIRFYRPKRIIEIGSGFSSRVINAAIPINQNEGSPCNYEIVDPFPAEHTKTLKNLSSIKISKAEELPENYFSSLVSGDILFIDSGHVVRTGSDVNFLILDILPTLQPGVVIHFHDICMPREYSKTYFTNPTFRMFWTESYLLQAFLAFNNEFEVLGAVSYLRTYYPDSFQKIFPARKEGGSESFWLRRVKKD